MSDRFKNFIKNSSIFSIAMFFIAGVLMAVFFLTEKNSSLYHLIVLAVYALIYAIFIGLVEFFRSKAKRNEKEYKNLFEIAQKAEIEAKLSEEKYLDLIENTPLCIKVFDENMKMVFLNKGGREEHFIKDTDDISKWDWVGTVKEQYQAEAKEKFKNAFLKGESSALEFEHTPEGSTHEWCSSLISPVKDKNGKVKTVLFLSSDITVLKKAELQAKQNEQMFKTLLDATPLCIKWFDNKGNLISINKGGREEHHLENLSEEEIKNWDYMGCIDEANRAEVKNNMDLALKKGITSIFEIKHVPGTSKGERCLSTLMPVKNSKGETDYVLFLSRDITDEKLIEEERSKNIKKSEEAKLALFSILEDAKESEKFLKEERNKFQAVLSSMNEGLFVVDEKFNIILLNPAAEKLFGISSSAATGKNWRNIITVFRGKEEIPPEKCLLLDVFKKKQPIAAGIEENIYFQDVSGRKFPVIMAAAPLFLENNKNAVVVFNDASKEKALDEAKSNFISISSHQLRTPLTSMRWFAEMLMGGDAGPITEEQKHFVERIYQATERMINLVNLLLQLARVEAGRLKVEPIPLNLKNLTQSVAISLKADLDKKSQKVEIVVNPDPFPEIPLDQEIIWQVIQNLISNASRYSPEGKNIQVSIVNKDGLVECSVKDQGIGIPKSQKDKIFERFFRADNALKMVPEGSGLGLSLVKLLVEEWGGKIWFDSEENKGATFFFTIPVEGMKKKEGEVKLAV